MLTCVTLCARPRNSPARSGNRKRLICDNSRARRAPSSLVTFEQRRSRGGDRLRRRDGSEVETISTVRRRFLEPAVNPRRSHNPVHRSRRYNLCRRQTSYYAFLRSRAEIIPGARSSSPPEDGTSGRGALERLVVVKRFRS